MERFVVLLDVRLWVKSGCALVCVSWLRCVLGVLCVCVWVCVFSLLGIRISSKSDSSCLS